MSSLCDKTYIFRIFLVLLTYSSTLHSEIVKFPGENPIPTTTLQLQNTYYSTNEDSTTRTVSGTYEADKVTGTTTVITTSRRRTVSGHYFKTDEITKTTPVDPTSTTPNVTIDNEVILTKDNDVDPTKSVTKTMTTTQQPVDTTGTNRTLSGSYVTGPLPTEAESIKDQTVDGGWGNWSDWTPCSKDCIGGTETRFRSCDNPAVVGTGKDCDGETSESRSCNDDIVCPGATDPLTASIVVVEDSPKSATLMCVDYETGHVLKATFSNGDFSVVGEVATVELNCDDPTWTCDVEGYNPVSIDITVPEFIGENTVDAILIKEGQSVVLRVLEYEATTIRWYKAAKSHGFNLLDNNGSRELTVNKAGRYTAYIKRCPQHTPVTKATNVISRVPNFNSDKKICSVFGDPHVLTFDGTHYTFHGECTYVLAMDCSAFTWFIYGSFTSCGEGATCLENLHLYVIDNSRWTMLELKRGFGINKEGVMFGLSKGETASYPGVDLSFDGLMLRANIGTVLLEWDGLSSVRIILNEGYQSCGLCSTNDGISANDIEHYRYGYKGLSFADSWAVSYIKGACGAHSLNDVEVNNNNVLTIMNKIKSSPFNQFGFWGDQDKFVIAAAQDLQMTGSSPFKRSYMECSCIRASVEHLRDTQGIELDRWDIDLNCPSPSELLLEGVRMGCPWTKSHAPFYLK